MGKINSKGEFLNFPGVNIISLTRQQDSHLWQRLFNFLKKSTSIATYYSVLPYQSYHMTINNLYTIEDAGKDASSSDWNNFISTNLDFFQMLNDSLKRISFTPEITISNNIVTEGVLQLQFYLPDDQISIINKFAARFKLESRLPNICHMTLAYQKPNKNLLFDQHKKIKSMILETVNEIFVKNKISLQPPSLCYFRDMTKFTPWDGMDNPFNHLKAEDEKNDTTSSYSLKRRF